MIELTNEEGRSKIQVAKARVMQASRTSVKQSDKGALRRAREELLVAQLERAIHKALHPPLPYKKISKAERQRLARELRQG